ELGHRAVRRDERGGDVRVARAAHVLPRDDVAVADGRGDRVRVHAGRGVDADAVGVDDRAVGGQPGREDVALGALAQVLPDGEVLRPVGGEVHLLAGAAGRAVDWHVGVQLAADRRIEDRGVRRLRDDLGGDGHQDATALVARLDVPGRAGRVAPDRVAVAEAQAAIALEVEARGGRLDEAVAGDRDLDGEIAARGLRLE